VRTAIIPGVHNPLAIQRVEHDGSYSPAGASTRSGRASARTGGVNPISQNTLRDTLVFVHWLPRREGVPLSWSGGRQDALASVMDRSVVCGRDACAPRQFGDAHLETHINHARALIR